MAKRKMVMVTSVTLGRGTERLRFKPGDTPELTDDEIKDILAVNPNAIREVRNEANQPGFVAQPDGPTVDTATTLNPDPNSTGPGKNAPIEAIAQPRSAPAKAKDPLDGL
jgi:hypothetical protein